MPHSDPEVKAAYHRAYNERNAERLREQRKAYAAANRDRLRVSWEAWRQANPERRRAIELRARRKFEQTHREKILDKNSRRRARILSVTVEKVDRMVVYARDRGRCGICGRFVAKASFHVDHVIPLARGGPHSYANVQVAHPTCNHRKRATMPALGLESA
jgi:5-methylcytosine-specific restriction endonuclease McrA